MMDRISYALFGSILGAIIGAACWWLYGMGHSLNYDGPGMDPVLKHWLTWSSGSFGLIGFIFRERVIDTLSDFLSAVTHFESNQTPNERSGGVVALVFLTIIIAAIWFTVP